MKSTAKNIAVIDAEIAAFEAKKEAELAALKEKQQAALTTLAGEIAAEIVLHLDRKVTPEMIVCAIRRLNAASAEDKARMHQEGAPFCRKQRKSRSSKPRAVPAPSDAGQAAAKPAAVVDGVAAPAGDKPPNAGGGAEAISQGSEGQNHG